PSDLGRRTLLLLGLLLFAGDVPAGRQLLGVLPPEDARGAPAQPESGERQLVQQRRLRPNLRHVHVCAGVDGRVPLSAHLPARRGADRQEVSLALSARSWATVARTRTALWAEFLGLAHRLGRRRVLSETVVNRGQFA